jgi:hypothetical protein
VAVAERAPAGAPGPPRSERERRQLVALGHAQAADGPPFRECSCAGEQPRDAVPARRGATCFRSRERDWWARGTQAARPPRHRTPPAPRRGRRDPLAGGRGMRAAARAAVAAAGRAGLGPTRPQRPGEQGRRRCSLPPDRGRYASLSASRERAPPRVAPPLLPTRRGRPKRSGSFQVPLLRCLDFHPGRKREQPPEWRLFAFMRFGRSRPRAA